jgi:CRISPR/Cas system-associated endoribonuclease Cas2
MKTSQISTLLITSGLLFSLIGCAQQKLLFNKPGLTNEEFNRDRYDCAQESRTSWSGGGTGSLGVAMIIVAKSNADKQSVELFKMCMEARGYTPREVSDEEFEKQRNTPYKTKMNKIAKELNDICNRDDFKLVFIKSACKIENITLEQLSDKNMISEVEKPVLSRYRSEITDSTNKVLDAIRTGGDSKDKEMSVVLERIRLQVDKNALDLFEGKITWGEYNKCRKELAQIIKEERSRIFSKK